MIKSFALVMICAALFTPLPAQQACAADGPQRAGNSGPALHWQAPARLHHGLIRSAGGTLVFTRSSISFESRDRQFPHRWRYVDIKTVALARRSLVLTSYENRWHLILGDRRYRFDLERAIPPEIAARVTALVEKPVIDADPAETGPAWSSIPARHRTLIGGTNGVLRFSARGIDYVTRRGAGGRSWRWADIQTIARPDPYRFRVAAYRETFDFELKRPMSRRLFDRLWDHVYGRGLQLSTGSGDARTLGREKPFSGPHVFSDGSSNLPKGLL